MGLTEDLFSFNGGFPVTLKLWRKTWKWAGRWGMHPSTKAGCFKGLLPSCGRWILSASPTCVLWRICLQSEQLLQFSVSLIDASVREGPSGLFSSVMSGGKCGPEKQLTKDQGYLSDTSTKGRTFSKTHSLPRSQILLLMIKENDKEKEEKT